MTESYILNATAGKNIIFSFLFYTNCTLRFDKTKCFCFFFKRFESTTVDKLISYSFDLSLIKTKTEQLVGWPLCT